MVSVTGGVLAAVGCCWPRACDLLRLVCALFVGMSRVPEEGRCLLRMQFQFGDPGCRPTRYVMESLATKNVGLTFGDVMWSLGVVLICPFDAVRIVRDGKEVLDDTVSMGWGCCYI
jgi:hypothetical protein